MILATKRHGEGTNREVELLTLFASMVKEYRIVRGLDLALEKGVSLPLEERRRLHCEYMTHCKAHDKLFSQCLAALEIPQGYPTMWFLQLLKDRVMKIDKRLKNVDQVAVRLYREVEIIRDKWVKDADAIERNRNEDLANIRASLGIEGH